MIEGRSRSRKKEKYQGKFLGQDFFVRFILDWNEEEEKYRDRHFISSGYARIKAEIIDDSNSIFTPSIYRVSEVQTLSGTEVLSASMKEIVSFRREIL